MHLGRAGSILAASLIMLAGIAVVSDIDGGSEAAVQSGTWGDLQWTLDADGCLTIRGDGAMASMPAGQSPAASHPTSAWLAYSGSIKSVIIENGVTSVGDLAFIHCASLESVTLRPSVTSIGDFAFYDCTSLKSIDIMGPVNSIGMLAFGYCPAMSVTAYQDVYDLYSWPSGTVLTPLAEPSSSVTSISGFVNTLFSKEIISDSAYTISIEGCDWLSVPAGSPRSITGTPTEAGAWTLTVHFLRYGVNTGYSSAIDVRVSSVLAPTNSPNAGTIIMPVGV